MHGCVCYLVVFIVSHHKINGISHIVAIGLRFWFYVQVYTVHMSGENRIIIYVWTVFTFS